MDVVREKEVGGALSDVTLRESRGRSYHSALETSRGCPMRACSLDEDLNSSHQLTAREMSIFTAGRNLPARASSGIHLFMSDVTERHFLLALSLSLLKFSLSLKFVDVFANVLSVFLEQRMCRGDVFLFLHFEYILPGDDQVGYLRRPCQSLKTRTWFHFAPGPEGILGDSLQEIAQTRCPASRHLSWPALLPCLAPGVQTEAPRQSHVCVQKRTVL